MSQDGEFIYDEDEGADFHGLFCIECDREWGNMPICPSCGHGVETNYADEDTIEILRLYVSNNATSYFTTEIIDAL
jgi:hypothetical protein